MSRVRTSFGRKEEAGGDSGLPARGLERVRTPGFLEEVGLDSRILQLGRGL